MDKSNISFSGEEGKEVMADAGDNVVVGKTILEATDKVVGENGRID